MEELKKVSWLMESGRGGISLVILRSLSIAAAGALFYAKKLSDGLRQLLWKDHRWKTEMAVLHCFLLADGLLLF
ncbi:hypothetical protein C6Y45_16810 [Alkalicoccus saliphilus]|uniref:Uncharacterized protein n=1 Tax=Alkalicoccus saliphilus TaxID=200989 RepID=A0A2T4U1V4_9BACI|nr:hypothetical protein C6Y45_16810 [Alkalicoccus saliphilus]